MKGAAVFLASPASRSSPPVNGGGQSGQIAIILCFHPKKAPTPKNRPGLFNV
jgi:hypothetical protein